MGTKRDTDAMDEVIELEEVDASLEAEEPLETQLIDEAEVESDDSAQVPVPVTPKPPTRRPRPPAGRPPAPCWRPRANRPA